MLANNVIEHGRDAWLCESRVSQANDRFKATIKYTLLLFNIAELLILDLDRFIPLPNSELVTIKVPRQLARAERDFGRLISSLHGGGFGVVVAAGTLVDLGVQDPGVARPRIEQPPDLLRGRPDEDVGHVRRVVVVIHH